MIADPLASAAFTVAIFAVALYALYWVIRRAVASGIRDARRESPPASGEDSS